MEIVYVVDRLEAAHAGSVELTLSYAPPMGTFIIGGHRCTLRVSKGFAETLRIGTEIVLTLNVK